MDFGTGNNVVASLLATADVEVSPAERKLDQFDARIKQSAKNVDSSFAGVGKGALDGITGGLTRLEGRIPVVGGLLQSFTREIAGAASSFDLMGRRGSETFTQIRRDADAALSGMRQRVAELRAELERTFAQGASKRGDFLENLNNRYGGRVDADFLRLFRATDDRDASGPSRNELLMSRGLSAEFNNEIARASTQFNRLERDSSVALGKVQQELQSATKEAEKMEAGVARLAAAGATDLGALAGDILAVTAPFAAAGIVFVGALAAIDAAAVKSAKSWADYANEIRNTAQEAGVSAQTMSVVAFSAGLAGESERSAAAATALYLKNLDEASRKNPAVAKTFERFGISAQDAARLIKDPDQALRDLLERLAAIPNEADRLDAAFKLAGRGGKVLATTAVEMGGSFKEAEDRAKALGVYVSQGMAESAHRFDVAWNEAGMSVESILYRIGQGALPGVEAAVEALTGHVADDGDQWRALGKDLGEFVENTTPVIEHLNEIVQLLEAIAGIHDLNVLIHVNTEVDDWARDFFGVQPDVKHQMQVTGAFGTQDVPDGVDPMEQYRLAQVGNRTDPETMRSEAATKARRSGGDYAPKGHKAKDDSKKGLDEQLAALKIIEDAEKRSFQRRQQQIDYFYSSSLSSVKGYEDARLALAKDEHDSELKVAQKELEAAQKSGLQGQERANAVAKAQDKIKEIEEKYANARVDIENDTVNKQFEIDKQGWANRISDMESEAGTLAGIYQRMAQSGLVSFVEARQKIDGAQQEILYARRKALQFELGGTDPDSARGKELASQIETLTKQIQYFHQTVVLDNADADREQLQQDQRYATEVSSIYEQITDMKRSSLDEQLRLDEAFTSNVLRSGRLRLAFDLESENIRADRERQALERQRAAAALAAESEGQRARVVAAVNAQIEAADEAHYSRRAAIVEGFLNQQREKLKTFSDAFGDMIADGSQQGLAASANDLKKWLDDAERAILKKNLGRLFRQIFNLQTAQESPDGVAGTGRSTGVLGAISKMFGIGAAPKDAPQIAALSDNTLTTRDNTSAVRELTTAMGGGLFGGGTATRPRVVGATGDTAGAIEEAGKQAVGAVTGAGEAQAGAVERTGKATTVGLTAISQVMISGLSLIAANILNANARGGFLGGLLTAAAGGFISGLAGGIHLGGGSSSGGKGDGGSVGGAAGKAAAGGYFPAVPGGRIIQVAEGGYDEMILSSDPKHRDRTSRLLAQFISATRIAPAFERGGWAMGGDYVPPAPRVTSSASSPRGGNTVVHLTQEIHTNDPASFQRSARQNARAARAALAHVF